MRTRTRFAILFACLALAAMAVGVAAIYEAVGLDAAKRAPAEAEALLSSAARRSLDESSPPSARLEEATESLIAARALLAESRVLGQDAVIRLALEIAAILAAVLGAAACAFFMLSRLITRGLDEIAAGALEVQRDRSRRFRRGSDPDLDAVARALNDLLDLSADQEARLEAAARLEGWREVASFLAHQLKNPLAALLLAAENGSLALDAAPGAAPGAGAGAEGTALARESLSIVRAEGGRLKALLDRFRDLAPAGLGSYGAAGEIELLALLGELGARAERSGASFKISGPGDQVEGGREARVLGDRSLLEQAFWNLFANSIEAGSGRSVSIEARVAIEGGAATVLVLDSNRGLDPVLLTRLGRERVSTKATGAGLGLILVRRILATQGGGLELLASEEGGLAARVYLPLAGSERKAT